MALSFNGATLATNIDAVVFNGTAVSKVMFNGVEVWSKYVPPSVIFTTVGSAYGCNNFSASSNTFTIGGGAMIAYSESTGFTGSTGGLGGSCGNSLYTSSGRLMMSGGSGYVDMEYLSGLPYFRGNSKIGYMGLISSRNTNPAWKTSILTGWSADGEYQTNNVKILR